MGAAPSITETTIEFANVVGTTTIKLSTLTSGRVVIATTDGSLVDDSDFTFSTDTLTVTKIAAYELTGKLTAGSTEIEGSAFDINGGTVDGISSLTSSGDLDIGAHGFRAQSLTADGLTSGRVVFAGTAGVLSDDSDLTFATDTLTFTKGKTTELTIDINQDYIIKQAGTNNIAFESQTSAVQAFFELFSADSDGTDNIGINIYSKGTPADVTNRERLQLHYSSARQFEINTEEDGTGTLLPLVIFTEGNTDQLKLNTDGSVSISGTTYLSGFMEMTRSYPYILFNDTGEASPEGVFHFRSNSDLFSLLGRNAGNSGWETVVDIERIADGGLVDFKGTDGISADKLVLVDVNADALILGGTSAEGGDIVVYEDASGNFAFRVDADLAQVIAGSGADQTGQLFAFKINDVALSLGSATREGGDVAIYGDTSATKTWSFDGDTGQQTIQPITTGTLMDFVLETEWTTGTGILMDFGGATTATGDHYGMRVDLKTNLTPNSGSSIASYRTQLPVMTQTSASTSNFRGFHLLAAGALEQNTGAGTINWRGLDITMPVMTETTGTIDSVGALITMSTATTGGDSYGIEIVGDSNANFDNHAGIYINMAASGDTAIRVDQGISAFDEGLVIGTTSSEAPLDISASITGFDANGFMRLENTHDTAADYVGTLLSMRAGNEGKAWSGLVQTLSYGRGDFVWLLDATADDNEVGTGDIAMRLSNAGDLTPGANAGGHLGTDALEWNDLWIDGTAYLDALTMHGDLTLGTTNKIIYYDAATYTHSDADGDVLHVADDVIQFQAEGGVLMYDAGSDSFMVIQSTTDDALIKLDSGTDGTTEISKIILQNATVNKWVIEKDTNDHFQIYDDINDRTNLLMYDNAAVATRIRFGDKNGALDATDFSWDPAAGAGMEGFGYDYSNGRLYWYGNGGVHYVTQTAGLEFGAGHATGAISGEAFELGDFVVLMVDDFKTDGSPHATFVKMEEATIRASTVQSGKFIERDYLPKPGEEFQEGDVVKLWNGTYFTKTTGAGQDVLGVVTFNTEPKIVGYEDVVETLSYMEYSTENVSVQREVFVHENVTRLVDQTIYVNETQLQNQTVYEDVLEFYNVTVYEDELQLVDETERVLMDRSETRQRDATTEVLVEWYENVTDAGGNVWNVSRSRTDTEYEYEDYVYYEDIVLANGTEVSIPHNGSRRVQEDYLYEWQEYEDQDIQVWRNVSVPREVEMNRTVSVASVIQVNVTVEVAQVIQVNTTFEEGSWVNQTVWELVTTTYTVEENVTVQQPIYGYEGDPVLVVGGPQVVRLSMAVSVGDLLVSDSDGRARPLDSMTDTFNALMEGKAITWDNILWLLNKWEGKILGQADYDSAGGTVVCGVGNG